MNEYMNINIVIQPVDELGFPRMDIFDLFSLCNLFVCKNGMDVLVGRNSYGNAKKILEKHGYKSHKTDVDQLCKK